MAFLSEQSLSSFGFKRLGKGVLLSEKVSIYGAENISIGDYSRIDDFCILSAGSGGIVVGSYVHISCYASLIGQARISIGKFSNISGRVSIYSSSDDFSGGAMIGPLVGTDYTNVQHDSVHIERHVVVGAGSIVLPGVKIGEGVSVGAMSLVNRDCDPYGIYVGSPARRVKERSLAFLKLAHEFEKKNS